MTDDPTPGPGFRLRGTPPDYEPTKADWDLFAGPQDSTDQKPSR